MIMHGIIILPRLNQLGQNIDNVSDNYHLIAQEWEYDK